MRNFLLSRLIELPLVLLGISTLLFFAIRASGDPIAVMAPADATLADIELLREQKGLNEPLPVQYALFLRDTLTLQFGNSFAQDRPAIDIVLERLGATLQLTLLAALVALAVAVPIGLLAGARGGFFSQVLMLFALIGQAMPVFWLGLLLILFFSVYLKLLPSYGQGGWQNLVLPVGTLAFVMMAKISRMIRSGMIEVLSEDYITAARAKGLTHTKVVLRHALRNVLIPVVTALGVDISVLLSGAVVTETVFTWPGLGRQLMQAILARDYPVVQATVFVVAALTVLINLSVDLVNAQLDPRLRAG